MLISFDVTLHLPDLETAIRSAVVLLQEINQGVKAVSGAQDTIAAELTNLTATVLAETTVTQAAVALLNGIPAMITAAVDAATAAGATPAQLAAFATLNDTIAANSTTLAAAVTANTAAPPAPTPTPAPAPTP